MNIRPDDKLAICVRSKAGNDGRLFKILGYGGLVPIGPDVVAVWNVEALDGKPVKWTLWSEGEIIRDAYLRAIRDNPGDEEFVTEARKSLSAPLEHTKPKKVEA